MMTTSKTLHKNKGQAHEDSLEQFETAIAESAPPVTVKRATKKYSLLAIADRLETQFAQGVPEVAVAEAVKAIRKLAE